ncbi:MAG: tRNA lysidine(34) synthetase TilS [Thermonemataceae bacterium]
MEASFLEFITKNSLFSKENKILLAVCGGVDSVVLAHLLASSGYTFAVAHCNFGLRGKEADADEQFVRQLAQNYGVPCYVKRFNTRTLAKEKRQSIQMMARALRYQWFNELLEAQALDFIATAHHLNDSIETVLFNLTKGTGLAGLHGILPKQHQLVRPLLFADKNSIEHYAIAQQLSWREDASNQINKYARNLIRNEVVPQLKQINPSFERTFQETLEKIRGVEVIFSTTLENLKQKLQYDQQVIRLAIQEIPSDGSRIVLLYELLRTFNFNFTQTKELLKQLDGQAGKQFVSETHLLVKDRNYLIITPKQTTTMQTYAISLEEEVFKNEHIYLSWQELSLTTNFQIPTAAHLACLDADKIVMPLEVRSWQEGDWFYPLGLKGRKKVSDFLTDLKIPRNLKQNVWVLTAKKQIVWVIGWRIDDRFKITGQTDKVLIIEKH